MAIRFRARHVHHALADYVETELARLGWVDHPRNFDTVGMNFLEFQPEVEGKEIKPNTVSVTLGDEGPDTAVEMGANSGGLWQVEYPLFIDVYGENASISMSIVGDLKQCLGDLTLPLRDYHSDAPGVVTTEIIYIDRDTLIVERPPISVGAQDIRRHWRVCKCIAEVTFAMGH